MIVQNVRAVVLDIQTPWWPVKVTIRISSYRHTCWIYTYGQRRIRRIPIRIGEAIGDIASMRVVVDSRIGGLFTLYGTTLEGWALLPKSIS